MTLALLSFACFGLSDLTSAFAMLTLGEPLSRRTLAVAAFAFVR